MARPPPAYHKHTVTPHPVLPGKHHWSKQSWGLSLQATYPSQHFQGDNPGNTHNLRCSHFTDEYIEAHSG